MMGLSRLDAADRMSSKTLHAGQVQRNVRDRSIASIEPCPWHVGFTPDCGRIAATQRNDASGQELTRAYPSATRLGASPARKQIAERVVEAIAAR
jgi:hypothetical protein